MTKATKENQDIAEWQNLDTLVYSSWNEYRDNPEQTISLVNAYPTNGEFCYWCAVNGNAFALKPKAGETCIATVEAALLALTPNIPARVYVIWQPKDHSLTAWQRWSKKWSQRTVNS